MSARLYAARRAFREWAAKQGEGVTARSERHKPNWGKPYFLIRLIRSDGRPETMYEAEGVTELQAWQKACDKHGVAYIKRAPKKES